MPFASLLQEGRHQAWVELSVEPSPKKPEALSSTPLPRCPLLPVAVQSSASIARRPEIALVTKWPPETPLSCGAADFKEHVYLSHSLEFIMVKQICFEKQLKVLGHRGNPG